jgi:hypothetical protein
MTFKPSWFLFGLWAVVASLFVYQTQYPEAKVEPWYSILFYSTMLLSLVYLWRRAKARQQNRD